MKVERTGAGDGAALPGRELSADTLKAVGVTKA
jgi:hypothetical protein